MDRARLVRKSLQAQPGDIVPRNRKSDSRRPKKTKIRAVVAGVLAALVLGTNWPGAARAEGQEVIGALQLKAEAKAKSPAAKALQ